MEPSAIDLVALRDMIPFAAQVGVRSGMLTATTRPLHKGRIVIVIVLETELNRDDGELAAKVTQTQIFHYRRS